MRKAIGVAVRVGLVGAALIVQGASLRASEAPLGEGGQRLVRDGVSVELRLQPLAKDAMLREGEFADVRFRVTDTTSGQPLAGVSPGAWLDPQAVAADLAQGRERSCKSRVGVFLKSSIGARPLLDLNSYFLMVMNRDASVSVVDPQVSVGGITSTLARIDLKQPPMDWVTPRDNKRVFVSMPEAGEVAVIDSEQFKLIDSVPAGSHPVRVALQPDERLLWVGNNAKSADLSGVTIIDTQSLKPLKHLATGAGHHEIAFSKDSRYAFVSNRDDGTVSIIDIASLTLSKRLKTGSNPLSVAYSPLSQAVYVADGKDGTVTVIDTVSLSVRQVIQLKKGLGPMGFSADGRFGIVLNTLENLASVIDAGNDSLLHDLAVSAEPYQVVFTQAYAYIRGLASAKVTMINLASLGEGRTPISQGFEAGPQAPRLAGDLPLASSLAVSRDDNAVFVVNPVDNTTYFYAEGMNAPMSGYPNRGQVARAALVIDRSLREVEPGLYSARIKLPPAGHYDVAFLLNQPSIIHCFTAVVEPATNVAHLPGLPKVEFMLDTATTALGTPYLVRFRIVQGKQKNRRSGVKDVQVRYFRAPSSRVQTVTAQETGDGVYQVPLILDQPGAWYLHVRAASLGARFDDTIFASVRVNPGATH
ncbi:40-residue YVTN family beta-propeller repeat-containing protein [Pseudomonas sp. ok272]|uniref:cytochrome D1 domain-containing protein n=1 Tax=unclassified Pseudomonas TaxID=196821 RepID=UPI0008D1F7E0|nr:MULTISPECIES: cytochrome D1 domain-containing protein [unclassified Pseudomonas]SEN26350.1 40-residue YVTN family beta-propeller repeat-containing protein [Pseudomonas sp. ok272]SFN17129.1 40-residue YVTN family beta-propeller repeat-containing protein [Pseudomonas sp. ok602]